MTLDIGCGEGRLPRDMKARGYHVIRELHWSWARLHQLTADAYAVQHPGVPGWQVETLWQPTPR